MVDKKRTAIQVLLLLVALAMLYFGVQRGEAGAAAEQGDSSMSGVCRHWVRNFRRVQDLLIRFRGWVQAGATLLSNLHLPGFFEGQLYIRARAKPSAFRGLTAIPVRRHPGPARSVRCRPRWAHRSTAFPIILSAFCCCWVCCWAERSADFYVPLAGCRSCCTKFQRRSFPRGSSNRCAISNMGFWS